MIQLRIFIGFVFACGSVFSQYQKLPLENWKFKPEISYNHSFESEFPAKVPGVVHLDLMQNKLADDFYAGDNENSAIAKWIESTNWIYTTELDYDSSGSLAHQTLVFEGLDTYAEITLNGKLLLQTDNMFCRWEIPLEGLLNQGKNILSVRFISPLNFHRNTLRTAPYQLPSGNETVEFKTSAYTRKAAYQFGWDFGPRFVTCGIWKPCYIESWSGFRLRDFFVQTLSLDKTDALLRVQFSLESDLEYNEPCQLKFMDYYKSIRIEKGRNDLVFELVLKDAAIWYPNGYGQHPVYHESITLLDPADKPIFAEPVHFAVRTIELINEPDSIGTSFYFKINNVPVFMKGANYVPQDLFLPRVTEEQTSNLLAMAEDCHMNMIRVWGGGIYESDFFYDQCDSRGILVWQDFMFANSMYPADSLFHQTVAAEVVDNVVRLRNHPCIALWCGNNEIEVAWHNWGWQKQFGYSATDSSEIWENYQFIFQKLIPGKLNELDASRPYISSSPQSNWGKSENFNHGAMHYWGVWHGKEPLENFKTNVGRFMVEYGFQSYPFINIPQDLYNGAIISADSLLLRSRQKSYVGDVLIEKEIERWYRSEIDKWYGGSINAEAWFIASQNIQAYALRTAIIAHRTAAPRCMGTLFWQLNDCWRGPSWSVIEYDGETKIAWSELLKFYSPQFAYLDETSDGTTLIAHSDNAFKGTIRLSISYNSAKLLWNKKYVVELDPLETITLDFYEAKKLKKFYQSRLYTWHIEIIDASGKIPFEDEGNFITPGIYPI